MPCTLIQDRHQYSISDKIVQCQSTLFNVRHWHLLRFQPFFSCFIKLFFRAMEELGKSCFFLTKLTQVLCIGPSGLSNLRVSVPSIVLRGETTNFNCSWDQDPRDKVIMFKEPWSRVSMVKI